MITDPIDTLLADLARLPADDHAARLRRVATTRADIARISHDYEQLRAKEVRSARAALTWREIGDILGVSLQRAHQLATPTTNPERTPQ